jgi:hypothetical protein
MTTTIDLGGGQSVPRHHLPKSMTANFDQASNALNQALASIRSWIRPLHGLQASVSVSGSVSCNAIGQSGRTYDLTEPGGALFVDERDLPTFTSLKFAARCLLDLRRPTRASAWCLWTLRLTSTCGGTAPSGRR